MKNTYILLIYICTWEFIRNSPIFSAIMHLLQYVKAMILEIYFNFFYEVNKVTGKYMWKVRQLVSKDCVGVAKTPPKTAVFLMCCVPAYDGTTVQTLSTKCSLSDASGHLTEHSAEISVDNLTLGDKFSESWKKKKNVMSMLLVLLFTRWAAFWLGNCGVLSPAMIPHTKFVQGWNRSWCLLSVHVWGLWLKYRRKVAQVVITGLPESSESGL